MLSPVLTLAARRKSEAGHTPASQQWREQTLEGLRRFGSELSGSDIDGS
jgi:hypothetical protein